MRQREKGAMRTEGNLSVGKILDITKKFPLLHAYGVGLDIFRELPEQYRMRSMEYAKFLLAYCLDDEIDDARAFLKDLKCSGSSQSPLYVRVSYLEVLFSYWRRPKPTVLEFVPPGAFIVAALAIGQRIKIIPSMKPDCLMQVTKINLRMMEKTLAKRYGFEPWPKDKKHFVYKVNDDRADDVGNEPQSIDAVEVENGE